MPESLRDVIEDIRTKQHQVHLALEQVFNEALDLVMGEPWPNLPDALCQSANALGLEITKIQAIDFLRKSKHMQEVKASRLFVNEVFTSEKIDRFRSKANEGNDKMKDLYEKIVKIQRLPAYQEALNTMQFEPFPNFPLEVMKLLSRDGIHLSFEQVTLGIQTWRQEELARMVNED